MAITTPSEHQTGLDRFIWETKKRYAKQKGEYLDLKFERNFQAVTNKDYRVKSWKAEEGKGWRSTTWIGIIRKKVMSFVSILIDTTLSNNKIPFELEIDPDDLNRMSKEELDAANIDKSRMEASIQKQLLLRDAISEYKKMWTSLPYYGMTFSKFGVEDVSTKEWQKGSYLENQELTQYLDEPQQYDKWEQATDSRPVPGHRYVSVWDIAWDMEESDFSKAGVTEKIYSSAYDLKQLKGQVGYFDDIIDEVISEQKGQTTQEEDESTNKPGMRDIIDRKKKFDHFEFWLKAPVELVDEFQKEIEREGDFERLEYYEFENIEEEGNDVHILGDMVNGRVIRLIENGTKKHPYKQCFMEENLDEQHGNGISDNAEDAQAWLIGQIRALEDNKKLSGNVILAVKENLLDDPSEINEIFPGMKVHIKSGPTSVRDAILPVVFPDVGETLISGIQMAERFLDTLTFPTILQGFTLEKHKSDTAFEADQLQKNAGTYIGLVIKNSDRKLIEPHIDDIIEYDMRDPDFRGKGNWKVHATGFVGFQNTIIRGNKIREMLMFALSSEILPGLVDLEHHLDEAYRSADLDPQKFLLTEDEKQAKEKQGRAAQAEMEQKAIEAEKLKVQIETEGKLAVENTKAQNKETAKESAFQQTILLEKKKAQWITEENDKQLVRDKLLEDAKSENAKELEAMKPKPEKASTIVKP